VRVLRVAVDLGVVLDAAVACLVAGALEGADERLLYDVGEGEVVVAVGTVGVVVDLGAGLAGVVVAVVVDGTRMSAR
jgi:hypothetical protein